MIARRDMLASCAFLGAASLTAGGTMLARGVQRELPSGRDRDFDRLPDAIGPWLYQPAQSDMIDPVVTDPAFANALRWYDRIVARDYVAAQLPRVMVSIAYKRVIRQDDRFHWPRSCYEAQGFTVAPMAPTQVELGGRTITLTRFVGQRAARSELVQYVIRTGDATPVGTVAMKAAILRDNLAMRVPDGTMLRTSLLLPRVDPAALDLGSRTLSAFIAAMYGQSPPEVRALLV